MGEVEMLARFRLHKNRFYRFEALNNVGYMLATLAASHSLLSYGFLQELLGLSVLFRSMMIIGAACLLASFALRFARAIRS